MRIHTNHPTPDSLFTGARQAASARHEKYSKHGSRTHATAREVLLEGESSYTLNTGRYGAGGRVQAATWDQWGIYLAFLFAADPTIKTSHYKNATHFHAVTGHRFDRSLVLPETVLGVDSPNYQRTHHRWDYCHAGSKPLTGDVHYHCVNSQHQGDDGTACTAYLGRGY